MQFKVGLDGGFTALLFVSACHAQQNTFCWLQHLHESWCCWHQTGPCYPPWTSVCPKADTAPATGYLSLLDPNGRGSQEGLDGRKVSLPYLTSLKKVKKITLNVLTFYERSRVQSSGMEASFVAS